MIPSNITKEHLLKAINEIEHLGIRSGRHSSTYDILYNGKRYPPKLVISIANRFINGIELDPNTFHGGRKTPAFELLEKEGFEVISKTAPSERKYSLNKDLFDSALTKYVECCRRTDWLKHHELYKFKFANWLHKRLNFDKQSDQDILQICIESQNQIYQPSSSEKGVNFITQIKRHSDHFISIQEIQTIREIRNGSPISENLPSNITLTLPKFSIWLSCLLPEEFNTYASNELDGAIAYLFDATDLPKTGIKAFLTSQVLLQEIRSELQQNEDQLAPIFKSNLNKENLEEIDWVWITQDFNLFIVRKVLRTNPAYYWVCWIFCSSWSPHSGKVDRAI